MIQRELITLTEAQINEEQSLRSTPEFKKVKTMMESAGFDSVRYVNDVNYRHGITTDLREAIDSSLAPLLTVAGTDSILNDFYERAQTSYQDYSRKIVTDKKNWLADPIWPSSLPTRVMPKQPIERSKFIDNPREITVAYATALIESFSVFMVEDDQTGQIPNRIGKMGEAHATFKDLYFTSLLYGGGIEFDGVKADSSRYTTIAEENGTVLTGMYHRHAKLTNIVTDTNNTVKLSPQNLARARKLFMQQRTPIGQKLKILPTTLIVASDIYPDAMTIVTSMYASAVPGVGQTAATASSGSVGQIGAANFWLNQKLNVVENPNLPDGAWFLTSGNGSKCGIVEIVRSPLTITPSAPNSHSWFNYNVNETKSQERYEPEIIECRTQVCGNLGSGISLTIDGVVVSGV